MDSHNTSSTLPIQFNGQAGEYFGIWIVNICLTLVTLGLYSPWAKIRQKRYFYGSTRIAGAVFDYVADPWAIFRGRLIAVALVVVIGFVSQFAPWVNGLAWLAFIIALPWLIVRTRRFNAVNTVYRNLRFGFNAGYGPAFVSFVLGPFLLLPLSLGLAQPWVKQKQMQLIVDNSSYGNSAFRLDASLRDFLSIFKHAALGAIIGIVVFGVTLALLMPHSAQVATEVNKASNQFFVGMLPLLVFWMMGLFVYLDVLTSNLVWNKTTLGGIAFDCQLRFLPLLSLHVTNILGVALSFGLLIPWAKVRIARYRLGCMGLRCTAEELQGFSAGQAQNVGALSEELSDFLDVDIGL